MSDEEIAARLAHLVDDCRRDICRSLAGSDRLVTQSFGDEHAE